MIKVECKKKTIFLIILLVRKITIWLEKAECIVTIRMLSPVYFMYKQTHKEIKL